MIEYTFSKRHQPFRHIVNLLHAFSHVVYKTFTLEGLERLTIWRNGLVRQEIPQQGRIVIFACPQLIPSNVTFWMVSTFFRLYDFVPVVWVKEGLYFHPSSWKRKSPCTPKLDSWQRRFYEARRELVMFIIINKDEPRFPTCSLHPLPITEKGEQIDAKLGKLGVLTKHTICPLLQPIIRYAKSSISQTANELRRRHLRERRMTVEANVDVVVPSQEVDHWYATRRKLIRNRASVGFPFGPAFRAPCMSRSKGAQSPLSSGSGSRPPPVLCIDLGIRRL